MNLEFNKSLNDQAMDDLHEEADYLTEDEGKAASLGTVRVETEEALDLKVPKEVDQAVSALSDYDVQIQTTKDDITKVYELEDVASTVLAQETIGQADAEEIERVYGGLYDNVASKQEYTAAPSSINLKETKNYVEERKALFESEAIQRHKDYLKNTSEQAYCLLQCLYESVYPETMDMLEQTRRVCIEDLSKASLSKNFLIYTKETRNDKGEVTRMPELIDLKTLRLYDSIKREEYTIPDTLQCLPDDDDVRKLREVFHSNQFRKLMTESSLYRDVLESLHRDFHNYSGSREECYDLTYVDLLTVFTSGKIEEYLQKAFEALADVAKSAKPIIEEMLSDSQKTKEQLSECALATSDFYEKLLTAEKFRMMAYMLCYRAEPILAGFRKAL